MRNMTRDCDKEINFTASAAVSSGDVVVVGNLLAVAVTDVANGDVGAARIRGGFMIPKATGFAIAEGDIIQWDVSAGNAGTGTAASGDVTGAAIALSAAASADTEVEVLLLPGGGAVTA